jgi:DNA polymerase-3 subunit epsilon
VANARARLADLQSNYTKEKSRVEALRAMLFLRLRRYYEKRDKLQLIVWYRRQYLEALLRGDVDGLKKTEETYKDSISQTAKDYEETASGLADKRPLTPDEEDEISRLWKTLVKLYHPDRFAQQPDKSATYAKLTGIINCAKDNGDIATLKKIAEDPNGFILSQGWSGLDFAEEEEVKELRRLFESLEREIIKVSESLENLRASQEYELSQLIGQDQGLFERLATEKARSLEAESMTLEKEAIFLLEKIQKVNGNASITII